MELGITELRGEEGVEVVGLDSLLRRAEEGYELGLEGGLGDALEGVEGEEDGLEQGDGGCETGSREVGEDVGEEVVVGYLDLVVDRVFKEV